MSIGVLLVLAALYLLLMRRFVLRRRRIAQGLSVSGPWHFPAWLRPRVPRWVRRRFGRRPRAARRLRHTGAGLP
ncbi:MULTISPECIES: hypothetical protein [unclassified Cryobacterium]|uniref:hypothetical protein n=1 Tax=unclassified Cryobacterium TaxID=2649013 RepID=UPI0011B0E56D|nr:MULTISPECIES: hypothetical protein [unclassified Cryobacterium]